MDYCSTSHQITLQDSSTYHAMCDIQVWTELGYVGFPIEIESFLGIVVL